MIGTTKAKRIKPQVESSVDSFLWRLANRRYSGIIVLAILAGAFLAGMLTAWVL